MRSSKQLAVAVAAVTILAVSANAASLDFTDPRRALGREDDIRVDAQLSTDTFSPGAVVGITYQIENLGKVPVAIASRITAADFDAESRTLTITIGAEVPTGTNMPYLAVVKPGEKRVFTTGAYAQVPLPSVRTPWTAVPRFVEIRVSLLRNVAPFERFILKQSESQASMRFPSEMFDQWVEGSDSIYLNAIPIRWAPEGRTGPSAADRGPAKMGGTF